MLMFRKILRMYLMDNPLVGTFHFFCLLRKKWIKKITDTETCSNNVE